MAHLHADLLSDWLDRFLQAKRASNKADKTLESYAYHLRVYIAWLGRPE